jgi:ribokinase
MGRVFVAGSINMDVVATTDRHPRIGETVAGSAVLYFPGGKGANQAIAAVKLGAPTTLIGRLGKDAFGDELKAFLAAQAIDLRFVQQTAEAHTGTAIITIAHAHNTIVVIPGANALVSAADVDAPALAKGDIAVSQFEIPLPTVSAFFKRARAAGATTILNPAPAIETKRELLDLVDILILNESELGFLAKTELRDTDDYARFIEAARSLQTSNDKTVCVTLGKRGMLALIDGQSHVDLGRAVKAIDTTGAGDCFVGAVAALLADGQPLRSALAYANIAASICVQRMGAAPSMPTTAEVEAAISASRPGERRDP